MQITLKNEPSVDSSNHLPEQLAFISNYIFLNNSSAFGDLKIFFRLEMLGKMFELRLVKWKKKRCFSASEGGW